MPSLLLKLTSNFASLAFCLLLLVQHLPQQAQMAPLISEAISSELNNIELDNQQIDYQTSEPALEEASVLLNWLQNGNKQKRHLFLSDGWGPGGRPLALGSRKQQASQQQQQQPSQQEVMSAKQKNDARKKHYYQLKWSIPGLFGTF